jgi:chemotaxis protein methyltransferase CheR
MDELVGNTGSGFAITDQEFRQFREFIHRIAGINLAPTKKALVCGRLSRRLRQRALGSFAEYYRVLASGDDPTEVQTAVDLLTTNETHFFREPSHFEFLRKQALAEARPESSYRVWSAACASGEEPYSIAMVLADCLGTAPWEVVASDLSARVLERARTGHYAIESAARISTDYLHRYCLKGVGPQQGTLLVDKAVRQRVQFLQINLNAPLPKLGQFHGIFLRNVMIYFDLETKRQVVQRLLPFLRPGGFFVIGHSETLNGVVEGLTLVTPSIYRKP